MELFGERESKRKQKSSKTEVFESILADAFGLMSPPWR